MDLILLISSFGTPLGIICGLIYGILIGKVGIPAFVVSLAGMLIFRGFLMLATQKTGTIIVSSDSFNKIGNQIKALNNSYETASKQLSEGSGNILTRVENLKKLGAKTTKTLKDSKIEFEDFDENRIEVLMLEE